jgi:4-hydroxymandelate oxidase
LDDIDAMAAQATRTMDPLTGLYINGGSGDSADANLAAWASFRLRPRMLRDVSHVSTESTVLGRAVDCPVLVAPTAMHRLVHPEGELATARGAAESATPYVVSMAATASIEDIAATCPAARLWMQMYVLRDRGATKEMCLRAAQAGCEALVVTVDSPVERGATVPFGAVSRSINAGMPLPNLIPAGEPADVNRVIERYAPDVTCDDIARLAEWSGGLPVVIKGVLRGDDARECVAAGAAGVAVSNHGGRQLPGCVPTAYALTEVVDAVGSDGEVFVDGGVRDGLDLVRALALGARAVLVGRPVLWALALGGSASVRDYLRGIKAQAAQLMGLSGCPRIDSIGRDLVTRTGR